MEQAVPSTSHLSEDTDPNLCEPSSSSDPHASSSQEPESAPKSKPQSRVGNFQPSVMYLKKLGIKVRDFAFESTLPPVPTYYLQPRQVQPSVNRPLQRRSTEPDDGSQQQSQGTQILERRPTEPVVTPEQTFRMKAFDNLEDYDELIVNSQESGVHQDSLSNFQVPTPTLETQNSTILLTTPSSIAEGRHTLNTESPSIPTSPTLHPLGSSQAAAAGSETAPHVQDLRNSNASSISGIFTMSFPSSPLTPLPSSPSSSPPNGVRVTPLSSQLSNTLRTNSTYEVRPPGTPRVLATSTRYFLRKRPSPSSSLTSPSKPSKRIRKFAPPESPLRPAPDSSTSSSSKSSSSRTKTTRTKPKKTKSKDKSGSSNSRSGRNASASKDKGKGKRKAC